MKSEENQALVEEGLVDEVVRQLMSGKEATVYVVRCGSEVRCAKVYKEAEQRNFRQSTAYQEGRKVKNSREARAREKGTRYGRKMRRRRGRTPRWMRCIAWRLPACACRSRMSVSRACC